MGDLSFRVHEENNIYMIVDHGAAVQMELFHLSAEGEDCRIETHVFPGSNKYMWFMVTNFQDFLEGMWGGVGASTSVHPLMRPIN